MAPPVPPVPPVDPTDIKAAETAGTTAGEAWAAGFTGAANLAIEEAQRKTIEVFAEKASSAIDKTVKLFATSVDTMDIVRQLTGVSVSAFSAPELTDLLGERQRKLADNMFEITKTHGEAMITLADGSLKQASHVYPSLEKISEKFTEVLRKDAGLYTAGMDGMTHASLLNMTQAVNAFNINQSALTEITRRELASTGQINGDGLKEFQKAVIATSNITGETYRKVSADIQGMLTDFTHFGMMSTTQMGALSGYVGQIGLSIGDIGNIAGKFQSFDGAISAMSDLTAATGVSLDAMELFKLANTDPEGFARSLKQQLEDQGLVYEEMDFIQQKLVAQSFGISPQKLQTLLNDQLQAKDSVLAEISAKSGELTDKQVEETTSSNVDYTEATKNFKEHSSEIIKSQAGMKEASLQNAISANNVMRAYDSMGLAVEQYYKIDALLEARGAGVAYFDEKNKDAQEILGSRKQAGLAAAQKAREQKAAAAKPEIILNNQPSPISSDVKLTPPPEVELTPSPTVELKKYESVASAPVNRELQALLAGGYDTPPQKTKEKASDSLLAKNTTSSKKEKVEVVVRLELANDISQFVKAVASTDFDGDEGFDGSRQVLRARDVYA